jgi:hypothetical protein
MKGKGLLSVGVASRIFSILAGHFFFAPTGTLLAIGVLGTILRNPRGSWDCGTFAMAPIQIVTNLDFRLLSEVDS